jgi:hypothetical protein
VIGGIFSLGRIADFLSRVRTEIRDELYKGAIEPRIGTDRIYLEVDDGVAAFLQRTTDPQTT